MLKFKIENRRRYSIDSISILCDSEIYTIENNEGLLESVKGKNKAILYLYALLSYFINNVKVNIISIDNVRSLSIMFKSVRPSKKRYLYELKVDKGVIISEGFYKVDITNNNKDIKFLRRGSSFTISKEYQSHELVSFLKLFPRKSPITELGLMYYLLYNLTFNGVIHETFDLLKDHSIIPLNMVNDYFSEKNDLNLFVTLIDPFVSLIDPCKTNEYSEYYDSCKQLVLKYLKKEGIVDMNRFLDPFNSRLDISFKFKDGKVINLIELPIGLINKFYLYWLIIISRIVSDVKTIMVDNIDLGMKENEFSALICNIRKLCKELDVTLIYSRV